MKIITLLSTLLCTLGVSTSVWAGPGSEMIKTTLEQQTGCENFVRYDDAHLFLGFGAYRQKPTPGKVHVASLGSADGFDLETHDSAIDLVSDGQNAYILTNSALEKWDLTNKSRVAEYSTYTHSSSMAYEENPQGMARYQDQLIIAHGRLGVSFFDLKTERITNQFRLVQNQLPLESMATGVTVQGDYAYVVMDNFSLVPDGHKQAFRGIIVIDMRNDSVVAQMDGMDPGADAITSYGTTLVTSFTGMPLWKYALDGVGGMPKLAKQISLFPIDGHPTGRAAMDDVYYYTCFSKAPEGQGGFYHRAPVALSRKQLQLD
jgi:hypothetical protein